MPDMRISSACRDARPDGESMRPDYCPIANEPCQSMCDTPCNRKELIAIRKDAERYRWLRSDDIEVPHGQREICVMLMRLPFREDQTDETLIESELDAAIDAAMQKGQS